MPRVEGQITISRPSANSCEPYISIILRDKRAACEVLEVEIGLAEFAMALTGLGHVDCEIEWHPARLARLGMIHEHKTELLPKLSPGAGAAEKAAAVAPYEVNGWRAVIDDLVNRHYYRGDSVLVTFHRYVATPDSEATND